MRLTFPLALGLLFIALKLTGYIAWSWLWVLAPFWVGIVLVLAILVVPFTILLIAAVLGGGRDTWRFK